MGILFYLFLAAVLILLNAFFVLAEFAVVKARPTQVDALAAKGNRRAKRLQRAQGNLDVFLSICQVGITLASIGLGFVGEPAFADLLKPIVHWLGAGAATDATAHAIAVTLGFIIVSFLHIVIGELIPKSLALRLAVPSALLVAYPMVFFYWLFRPSIWLLNGLVNFMLRCLRLSPDTDEDDHGEDEIRLILGQSQAGGVMSFRRLLLMENVLDLGGFKVRNAMHPRSRVRTLRVGMPQPELDQVIADCRYSRYILLGNDSERPLGLVHVKDMYLAEHAGKTPVDLLALVRPCLSARERQPLEALLAEMQSKGMHMATVYDQEGRWTGIITMEDAIEEVLGTIEEEFPVEPNVRLSDFLTKERVLVDVQGNNVIDAARQCLSRVDLSGLGISLDKIMEGVAERERSLTSYVGRGLAIPHARIEGLTRPVVVVAKLATPIPAPREGESIGLLFIMLTPAGQPRIHQILLAKIAGIYGSEFLEDRLSRGVTPEEIHTTISTAEQTALG